MGRGGAVSIQTHSEVTADIGPKVGNGGYGAAQHKALERKSLDAATTGPASAPPQTQLHPSEKEAWAAIEPIAEVRGS